MLATGMQARGVMAELTGRAAGYSRGKGGSMHMFSKSEELLRRARHRRRPGQPGQRPGVQQLVSRQRPGVPDLFRRGRVEPGAGVRKPEPRGAAEAADRVRDREQQVRHGHQRGPGLGVEGPVEERRALGHPGRAGGRHGRAGGEGRRGRRSGGVPRRQGTVSAGGEDLPLSRPLDVRPGALPHPRGGADDAHPARLHRGRAAQAGGHGGR